MHHNTIKSTWRDTYPEDKEFVETCAMKSKMPKPIGTRWGSVADSERHALTLGGAHRDRYVHVIGLIGKDKHNASGASKKRKVAQTDDAAQLEGVDVIALDATNAYRQTHRKYRMETIRTLGVPAYWELMNISFHTREPWHHMMCFLQTDPGCDPERYGPTSTQLSVLVGGKYNEFLQEFENILDNHGLTVNYNIRGSGVRNNRDTCACEPCSLQNTHCTTMFQRAIGCAVA